MIKDRYHQRVVFGYGDKETADKLSTFFEKHTGKYIDFNKMRNPKSGFRLLVFYMPLGKIEEISITTAGRIPSSAKKFASLQEFIDWYENEYLPNRITAEQIRRASIFPFTETKKPSSSKKKRTSVKK